MAASWKFLVIWVIDNYDSFVHTLARYLRELDQETCVVRNDAAGPDAIAEAAPTHIVLSPGPGTPDRAGHSIAVIRQFAGRIPILGVCLGHQAIGAAFGARICRARRPLHGEAARIRHDGTGIFAGLPNPLRAARYHSLIVERLPPELEATAFSDENEIMALRHRSHPTVGVQFHPESILTEAGANLLLNFLDMRC